VTSSSDPYVVRSPGLAVRGTVVSDTGRHEVVEVTPAGGALLGLLEDRPVRLSELCGGPEGEGVVTPILELSLLGMVSARLPLRTVLGVGAGGFDARLGLVLQLGIRRLPVGPRGFAGVLAQCVRLFLAARARVLGAVSTVLVLGTLVLSGWSAGRLVDAALAPVLLAVTVVAHEAGHLAALRRLPGLAAAGALMLGPTHLSVLRPQLSGSALRKTSIAGPLTGVAASVALAGLSAIAPLCGIAGLLGVAWHAANLLPAAPDGGQLWRGEDQLVRGTGPYG
jgi:Zn-dependent protease